MENITINVNLLETLVKSEAGKLAGRLCKRCEISQDVNEIKRHIKELAYESYRDLYQLIIACDGKNDLMTLHFPHK